MKTPEQLSLGGEPPAHEPLTPGAFLLHAFVQPDEQQLYDAIQALAFQSPFRHMSVRGGKQMSVAMTNAGPLGWVSDLTGYRYDPVDPESGRPWPAMPPIFQRLSAAAAEAAGYSAFHPDACLVNRYAPGSQMGLHQDRDELDLAAPIVSVSLGLPATFLFGGLKRSDTQRRFRLVSGDVVVWGGPARLFYHGVTRLAPGSHPVTGDARYNLTFRKVRRD